MDNDAAYCAAMEERFSRAVGAGEMSAAEARRRVEGMRGLDPQPPDVDRLRSGVTADPALSLLLLREDLVTMMGELNAWVEHEFGQRDDRLAKLEELVDSLCNEVEARPWPGIWSSRGQAEAAAGVLAELTGRAKSEGRTKPINASRFEQVAVKFAELEHATGLVLAQADRQFDKQGQRENQPTGGTGWQ